MSTSATPTATPSLLPQPAQGPILVLQPARLFSHAWPIPPLQDPVQLPQGPTVQSTILSTHLLQPISSNPLPQWPRRSSTPEVQPRSPPPLSKLQPTAPLYSSSHPPASTTSAYKEEAPAARKREVLNRGELPFSRPPPSSSSIGGEGVEGKKGSRGSCIYSRAAGLAQ